ncbi:MAG: FadR/GntR family transcriptional regulator [Solirubrobacterales bacterium]
MTAKPGRAPAVAQVRPTRLRGASEEVAFQIQHYIQREGLSPGDFLGREGDLAEQFGVSRPTLREGLRLLASGSLVRASKGPGGGIFVAHTAEDGIGRSLSDAIAMLVETGAVSLDELLDARMLLEVPLAGRAAQTADSDTVARLRQAVEAEAEAEGESPEAVTAFDAEIHRIIASAADNRMAAALTAWVFEVLQPKLAEVLDEAIVHSAVLEQHDALLAAMEKGDPARAERAMREHLLYLRDVLRLVEGEDRG